MSASDGSRPGGRNRSGGGGVPKQQLQLGQHLRGQNSPHKVGHRQQREQVSYIPDGEGVLEDRHWPAVGLESVQGRLGELVAGQPEKDTARRGGKGELGGGKLLHVAAEQPAPAHKPLFVLVFRQPAAVAGDFAPGGDPLGGPEQDRKAAGGGAENLGGLGQRKIDYQRFHPATPQLELLLQRFRLHRPDEKGRSGPLAEVLVLLLVDGRMRDPKNFFHIYNLLKCIILGRNGGSQAVAPPGVGID